MSQNTHILVANAYSATHDRTMELVKDLTETQLSWRADKMAPSVRFHVWHVARWADLVQEIFNGAGTQLWDQDHLGERWGFPKDGLGTGQAGGGIDDATALKLPLPEKEPLLEYGLRTFAKSNQAVTAAAEATVDRVRINTAAAEYFGEEAAFVDIVLRMLRHDNRHVGNIESLRGLLGIS